MKNWAKKKAFTLLLVGTYLLSISTLLPSLASADSSGSVGSFNSSSNSLPYDTSEMNALSYNGYAYVLPGFSSGQGGATDNVFYEPINSNGSVGNWTTSSSTMPVSLFADSGVIVNGYLYVIGGYSSGTLNTTYYAKINSDGSLGSWTTSPNTLPQGVYYGMATANNGTISYVGGSTTGSNQLNTVYYTSVNPDGSIGSWSTSSNSLPQGLEISSGVSTNGYYYLIGGQNGSGTSNNVYYAKYNSSGSLGAWQTANTTLPQSLRGINAAAANGFLYAIGGANSSKVGTVYYTSVNSDGSVNNWNTSSNTLSQGDAYGGSFIYDNYFYLFGGSLNTGSTTDSVYSSNIGFSNQQSTTGPSNQAINLSTPLGTNVSSVTDTSATTTDTGYSYPLGLVNFTFNTTTGSSNQVSLTFQSNLQPNQVTARKYDSSTKTYSTISGASVTETTLNGQPALDLTYTIVDGGSLDFDGQANGVIVDPVSLATNLSAVSAPSTGDGQPIKNHDVLVIVSLIMLTTGLAIQFRRQS